MEPTEQPEPVSALDEILTPTQDGYRLALHEAADISAALLEQTQRTVQDAVADREDEGAVEFQSELDVQPRLFDLRGTALDDAYYLESVLDAARGSRLRPQLIERLEAAVDHSHELAVLLAECAIATAQPHAD
ncbi:hypothetical protein ACFWFU_38765 [Streptomyces sp. NPDC060235]|uniref:hypothetical protein n=1 Tax=Streptomyces sp. NPDC060235 TaxID=3347080 RepID=UPI00364BCD7C